MTSDKPMVLMIMMRGHKLSEEYARISRKSWENQGYKVKYIDGYTPETMPDYMDLSIRTHSSKTRALDDEYRKQGKYIEPYFSETEKAIWYTHHRIWKYIIKTDIPAIIAEHDAKLSQMINGKFEVKDCYFRQLAENILGASYFTPQFLRRYLKFFRNNPRINPDGDISDFIKKYERGERGEKLDKPLIHNLSDDKPKDWLMPWPVHTFWAQSTIEHGLHNIYDEEHLDDTDT